jgi:hypothetical protein
MPSTFDPHKAEEVLRLAPMPMAVDKVARAVGLSWQRLNAWLGYGRAARERQEADQPPEPDDETYLGFLIEWEKARTQVEVASLNAIREAGAKRKVQRTRVVTDGNGDVIRREVEEWEELDWRARAWLLRHSPATRAEYSERTEVTGADGGPVEIDVSAMLARAREDLERIRVKREALAELEP